MYGCRPRPRAPMVTGMRNRSPGRRVTGGRNPSSTIVFSHGGNGMKEKWDNYQIEWARRGFVVLSFDLYGMGDSEILNNI